MALDLPALDLDAMVAVGIGDRYMRGSRVGFDAGGPTGYVVGDHVAKDSCWRLLHECEAGIGGLKGNGEAAGFVVAGGDENDHGGVYVGLKTARVRFVFDGEPLAERQIRGWSGCR
jgi:hypothetical protein